MCLSYITDTNIKPSTNTEDRFLQNKSRFQLGKITHKEERKNYMMTNMPK